MSETTIYTIAQKMAEAIREWNRAKHERESWVAVPGQVPPVGILGNAKQANALLTEALEEYEAFQRGARGSGSVTVVEITKKAVQYMSSITGSDNFEEAEEFLQMVIGLCNVRHGEQGLSVGEEQLIESTLGLVEYRRSAGPLNFQLEKADTFIFRMTVALEAMGVIQLPLKPEN